MLEKAQLLSLTRSLANECRGRTRLVNSTPTGEVVQPCGEPPRNQLSRSTNEGRQQQNRAGDQFIRSRTVPPPGKVKSKGNAPDARRANTPPVDRRQTNVPSGNSSQGETRTYSRYVPGECRWCADNRRPYTHDWQVCRYRRDFFAQRDERLRAQGITPPTFRSRSPAMTRPNQWNNGPPRTLPRGKGSEVKVQAVATGTSDHATSSGNSQ